MTASPLLSLPAAKPARGGAAPARGIAARPQLLPLLLPLLLACLLSSAAPAAQAQSAARVDDSVSARSLDAVPRRAGEKATVAIYEFRSTVSQVPVAAARDMFVSALVRSGAFAVAERQRLQEGVMRERQWAQSGLTTAPAAAQGAMAEARYIFEVVVSEASSSDRESSSGVQIGGLRVGGGSTVDSIGLDVRIVDVRSGLVVDAVNVVKALEAKTSSVSGVGQLLGTLAGLRGRALPVPVDAESRSSRKEGVDRALRSCIETAVAELARRLVQE